MKRLLKTLGKLIDLRDILVFSGIFLVLIGVAQIYVPAAWIVGGLMLLLLGFRPRWAS